MERGRWYAGLSPVAFDAGPASVGHQLLRWPSGHHLCRLVMHEGWFTEPADMFPHPFWSRVRDTLSDKAIDMRRQGFFGVAMLPRGIRTYRHHGKSEGTRNHGSRCAAIREKTCLTPFCFERWIEVWSETTCHHRIPLTISSTICSSVNPRASNASRSLLF